MFYQCTKCHKFFSTKYHYNTHLQRKLPCNNKELKILHLDVNNKLEEDSAQNLTERSVKNDLSQSYPINNEIKPNSKVNGFTCEICNKI
jgi:hypothetical protein